ncbi:MAG: hypothetical protein HOL98_03440 [Gammaproteobacteria bacterium]|nr:hypothetical protein [Gammaproteobacteria bacterium]MBT6246817.1 hypothetical protein [Gammaproteobacteria bacterium]
MGIVTGATIVPLPLMAQYSATRKANTAAFTAHSLTDDPIRQRVTAMR